MAGLRLVCVLKHKVIKDLKKGQKPLQHKPARCNAGRAAVMTQKFCLIIIWRGQLRQKRCYGERLDDLKLKYIKGRCEFCFGASWQKMQGDRKELKQKILIKDRSNYPLINGYVRITIGTREQMKRLMMNLRLYYEQCFIGYSGQSLDCCIYWVLFGQCRYNKMIKLRP